LANADERSFVSVIVRGGRSDMPGFEAVLTAQEIADVAAYVVQELGE